MRTVSKSAILVAGAHFVALATLGLPSVAHAQDGQPAPASAEPARAVSGGDVIELKNGGVLRGTIVDAIPNGHARIQLVTGEIATVPWQDIARIARGAAPAAPAAAPGSVSAPIPAAAADTGTPVRVHIEGSQVAELQEDTVGDGDHWQTVCTAPCDKAVSSRHSYRIIGDGIRDSSPFNLEAQAGDHHTITVDEGSKGGFVLGIVGTIVGGVTTGVGALVVLVAAAATSIDESDGYSTRSDTSAETTGWVITGVGVAALVGGIILIVSNSRTRVSQGQSGSPAAASLPSTEIASRDWMRVPGFKDAKRDTHDTAWMGGLPPAVTLPILSGRF